MTVSERRSRIEKNIRDWQALLAQLQDACEHTFVKRTAGSSTGHYDPSCNSWWHDFHCEDCGKRWRESQ